MLSIGFGSYAVEAFKRDKKRRKTHTPFSKNVLTRKGKRIGKVFPKASELQLLTIREQMKKQNRKERDSLIVSFILAAGVISGLVLTLNWMFA
jgi:riboflavin transporter FmnP